MKCNLHHSTTCSHTILVASKGFLNVLQYMTIIAIDCALDQIILLLLLQIYYDNYVCTWLNNDAVHGY